ncbi:GDP-mannose 4,6-dehydratase [Methylophaga sp.]|uniref:GDP-mannose 4,6-dehydratase n=1 Tax=Methylophaga sp. TaxID=2024840 RepID=UPI0025DDC944|nr:GDP-mannose 4,6-dehydratase [Methylophaga sp.]
MSKYLISGISGQDGRIAAELLSKQGHTVAGLTHNPEACEEKIEGCTRIWFWNWFDETSINQILEDFRPDCFIHLAASHISSIKKGLDCETQKDMFAVNLSGLAIILRCIIKIVPNAVFINASSSQIYSATSPGEVVNELSNKIPNTFYGYTKLSGMNLVDYYRREHGLKGGSSILFNHESHYRGLDFVTRVISKTVAEIKLGKSDNLHLRNIGSKVDMSSAYDVVQGMILMSEKNLNSDYILSSFKAISILDLVSFSFEFVNLDWNKFVTYDQQENNNFVIGDNTRSKTELNWLPEIEIKTVMASMIDHDLSLLKLKP